MTLSADPSDWLWALATLLFWLAVLARSLLPGPILRRPGQKRLGQKPPGGWGAQPQADAGDGQTGVALSRAGRAGQPGESRAAAAPTGHSRASPLASAPACPPAGTSAPLLILHASQSGQAEALARAEARRHAAHREVVVLPLGRLTLERLQLAAQSGHEALFLASTTGEGEPPDSARRFHKGPMAAPAVLAGLRYGLLALGDRSYARFCGFGHDLDAWLKASGAAPAFALVEMDRAEPDRLEDWRRAVAAQFPPPAAQTIPDPGMAPAPPNPQMDPPAGRSPNPAPCPVLGPAPGLQAGLPAGRSTDQTGAAAPAAAPPAAAAMSSAARATAAKTGALETAVQSMAAPDGADFASPGFAAPDLASPGQAPPFTRWHLADRSLLNPGSPGMPLWRLRFHAPPVSAWQAGDLVTFRIPQPGGGVILRDYSLASLPGPDGAELLVRAVTRPDGEPGRGSGWLTSGLQPGAPAEIQLRANPGFRLAEGASRLVLIGNGSGLAGLLAHLRANALRTAPVPAWLVFGERTRAHDLHFDAELQQMLRAGTLTRLDRCFSREAGGPRHVQDLLRLQGDGLRGWILAGATILVSGSREGMAEGVRQVLEDLLGLPGLEALEDRGQLRQDVY